MMLFPRTPDQHRRIALRTEIIGVQAATEHAIALMQARPQVRSGRRRSRRG